MALIKCPECGKEVSDKAEACIHCGFPLPKSELIVHGLTQQVLGGTVKIFLNGVQVASVGKGEKVVIPIEADSMLSVKCGINFIKEQRLIKAGKRTVINIIYNRLSGAFILSEE